MNTENIEAAMAKYNTAKNEASDIVKAELTGILKQFLADNDVDVLTWTQYTPFWNDGDTCEFCVNELYFSPTQVLLDKYPKYFQSVDDELEVEIDGEFVERDVFYLSYNFMKEYGHEPAMENLDDLQKFLENIDTGFMEDILGNHVRVVVTNAGIKVDECDHE